MRVCFCIFSSKLDISQVTCYTIKLIFGCISKLQLSHHKIGSQGFDEIDHRPPVAKISK
jgi:hypothetical protein